MDFMNFQWTLLVQMEIITYAKPIGVTCILIFKISPEGINMLDFFLHDVSFFLGQNISKNRLN